MGIYASPDNWRTTCLSFLFSGESSVLFAYFWLSVSVQLIAWKVLPPRNDLLCIEWDVKHAITHLLFM